MDYNFNQNNETQTNNFTDAYETEQNYYTSQPRVKKSHPLAKKIGVFMLCGAVFGVTAGGAFRGMNYFTGNNNSSVPTSTLATLTTTTENNAPTSNPVSQITGNYSVKDIAKNCMPSIVAITNMGITDVRTLWGTFQQESQSAGSGVIIGQTDSELLIVTNYHVVADSKTLTVVFSYDESNEKANAVEAYIKGFDEDKDLAVIGIAAKNLTQEMTEQLSIATIGNSNELCLGEQVVAIGNALGYGQSVTTGIVSALNRSISSNSGSDASEKYIQTDTAINPGNSGGALFNMNGELIGINSAKIADSQVEGMGYAIPISDVYNLIQDLMNQTTRTEIVDQKDRGYLGITGSDVTSEVSESYGFPEGIFISSVSEGSAAEKAGLVKGNIITKFDGKAVSSISRLQNLLAYYHAGESVTITIKVQDGSDYVDKDVTVTLSSAKEAGISSSENNSQPSQPYEDNSRNNEQQYPDFNDWFNRFFD